MIFNLLINFVVMAVGAIFNQLPAVTTLPTIGGFDIDSALYTGMGAFNTFTSSFWLFKDIFVGFLVIGGYYGIMLLARMLLGHRAPGLH